MYRIFFGSSGFFRSFSKAISRKTFSKSLSQATPFTLSNVMPPKRKAAAKPEMIDSTAGGDAESSAAPTTKRGRSKKDIIDEDQAVEKKETKSKRNPKGGVDAESAEGKQKKKELVPSKGKSTATESEEDVPKKKPSGRAKKMAEVEETAEEIEVKQKTTKKGSKKDEESNGVSKEKGARKRKGDVASEVEEVKPKGRKKNDKEEKPDKPAASNSTTTDWKKINFSCTKKNSEGNKPNLKISCWNIGGLKSWVKKDCLKFLEYEKPDIFCIQETKCSQTKLPDEIKELDGYKMFWCASTKEGYAGVGFFSKNEPLSVSYGIEDEEQDEDGRCITAEFEDFYVVCVYVPNAGRKLVTLPKRLKWNEIFKDYIKELDSKKPVIICGDMNVAHNEIDLARPSSNTKNAGFTKEEREGMTDFLEDGYIDTFRQLYPDKSAYTFWTYMAQARSKNIGWRVDYMLVSQRLMDKVCDSVIRTEIFGSDHCPMTLFLGI